MKTSLRDLMAWSASNSRSEMMAAGAKDVCEGSAVGTGVGVGATGAWRTGFRGAERGVGSSAEASAKAGGTGGRG